MNLQVKLMPSFMVKKSMEDPFFDAENNINGTLNLLDAARKSDIKRYRYIGSAEVYGKPVSLPINEEHPTKPLYPYGLSKLTGERYAMLSSMDFLSSAFVLSTYTAHGRIQIIRIPE